MSILAQASKRAVLFAKQSGLGTIAAQSATAQYARRKSFSINHTKNTFETAEIRSDFQVSDMSYGQNLVSGDINAEVYPGAFTSFFSSLLRKAFASGTNSTAAAGDGFTITTGGLLTRGGGSSGSFVTDGRFVGEVVNLSTWGVPADQGRPAFVTAVTTTTLQLSPLDGVAFTAVATPNTTAVLTTFKSSYVPLSGHTEDIYTIEDRYTDLNSGAGASIVYQDCRVHKLALKVSPNAYVDATFSFIGTGANQDTSSAAYFTGTQTLNTKPGFTGVKAQIIVNGVVIPIATGFQVDFDLQATAPQVVAARISPDVLYGNAIKVSGNFTAFLKDQSIRTLFANETEVPIQIAFYSADETQVLSIAMPRCKITSDTRDDPATGIIQTANFMALQQLTAPTSGPQSTVIMQDSAA